MKITIETMIGSEGQKYIELLSTLRINTFREYPYLYEGNLDYEKKYVAGYLTSKQSLIAVAKVDEKIAGISTGIPLISESDIVADAKLLFEQNNINPEHYYYYGEIIVLPEYRQQGLTKKLYAAKEKLVKQWGYQSVCFLTVTRPDNHTLQPLDYEPLDPMWKHLQFHKNNLKINYKWPTLQSDGSVIECDNEMEFWCKALAN